jgi:hypothetical protein
MTSPARWLNATQVIGLTAYLSATVVCGMAWARSHGAVRGQRLAGVLAVLEAALSLDLVLNGRWRLHDLLEGEATARSIYEQRTVPQLMTLSLVAAAAAIGMGMAIARLRGRVGAAVAVCGAILSLSLWCAEVISLHTIDAVFHDKIDGVMLVGWGWVICAMMTGLGILWESHPARGWDRSE